MAAAAAAALVVWLPCRQAAGRTDVVAAAAAPLPLQGFALQLPDLLLVVAAAMLLNLAPVLLIAALSLVASAAAAARVLRGPVYTPEAVT